MKKILIAALIAIVVSTAAFGATSSDVYLRQDVFEAKMDAFMAEIRLMNEQTRTELRKEIQATETRLSKKIQDTETRLNEKIQATETKLNEKIQATETGLRKEIQANTTAILQMNARIDAANSRIDVTNARPESLIAILYWEIALLCIFITLAAVVPSIVQVLKGFQKSTITLEDVERLIDAKFQAKNAQGA